jgi:hypothetical protein
MKAKLVYHKKLVEPDGGIIEIKFWSVPVTPDKPQGVKYSLVSVKGGKRLIGYDHAEGKGHHRHLGEKEEPYRFRSIERLFQDFHRDLNAFKQGGTE